jgi:Mg-chelatase subunit ChlD
MADLIKKDVFGTSSTGLTLNKGKLKSTSSPFQSRVNNAKASQPDAASMPHRLCLMLDRSSSMHGDKIQLLKDAIDNFCNRCDFQNTSIAVETFPASLELGLTNVSFMITSSVASLNAQGNTPMKSCVQRCLEKIPMTRGIIVSDGEATDWRLHLDDEEGAWPQDDVLNLYKKASIPIDTVHIGDSTSGEELLRRIAKETGGIYLKFTDVSAFANAFGFLTPSYRAQLTDGSMSANDLGAKEVRR